MDSNTFDAPSPAAWRHHAACRDADPALFYPRGNTGDAADQIALAKAWCRICFVRSECLEHALASRQRYGVWGGCSEDERATLRRERNAQQVVS